MAKKPVEDLSKQLAALTIGAPPAHSMEMPIFDPAINAVTKPGVDQPVAQPVASGSAPEVLEQAAMPEVTAPTAPVVQKRRGRKPKSSAPVEKSAIPVDARLVRIHLSTEEIEQASVYLPISGLVPKGAMTLPVLITYLARIGLQTTIAAAKANLEKKVF